MPPTEPAPRRRWTRTAFYLHLWLGVVATLTLASISITGVLLNHKRGLGLMPEVEHQTEAPLRAAVSVDSLALSALHAVPVDARGGWTPGAAVDPAVIDRMDVRPRNGFVKVRFRDRDNTEATVDLATGRVLHIGARNDVFLEKLHSGEIFGDGFILLSDAGAIALMVTLVTGYWLWLAPRLIRHRPGRET
ncbi:MAG: PepSY domain-containing protein [Gemmatimonadetes bacterium]|nr:PepSY domain-containing protein [Gemmatimonadota bacterium]